jgi:hypothetical protein
MVKRLYCHQENMPANKAILVVGIDPGAIGALTLITHQGVAGVLRFMKFSYAEVYRQLYDSEFGRKFYIRTYIENVHAFGKDHPNTAFAFGKNLGGIQTVIEILRYDTVLTKVDPKTWQYHFGLGGKHGPAGCTKAQEQSARKKAHHAKAKIMFPFAKVTGDMADSMLIARYGLDQEGYGV